MSPNVPIHTGLGNHEWRSPVLAGTASVVKEDEEELLAVARLHAGRFLVKDECPDWRKYLPSDYVVPVLPVVPESDYPEDVFQDSRL